MCDCHALAAAPAWGVEPNPVAIAIHGGAGRIDRAPGVTLVLNSYLARVTPERKNN